MELRQDDAIKEMQTPSNQQAEENGQTEVFVSGQQSEWGKYEGFEGQQGTAYTSARPQMTKKEFYRQPEMKKTRANINACGIVSYFCAAITFLVNVVLTSNIFGMLDVMMLIGLGLGVQLGKSRACAIVLTVYAGLNMIYTLVMTGKLGGYLILICGIYAVIETFKFQKAWKEYELTGR